MSDAQVVDISRLAGALQEERRAVVVLLRQTAIVLDGAYTLGIALRTAARDVVSPVVSSFILDNVKDHDKLETILEVLAQRPDWFSPVLIFALQEGGSMHHVIRRCADVMDYKVTHRI